MYIWSETKTLSEQFDKLELRQRDAMLFFAFAAQRAYLRPAVADDEGRRREEFRREARRRVPSARLLSRRGRRSRRVAERCTHLVSRVSLLGGRSKTGGLEEMERPELAHRAEMADLPRYKIRSGLQIRIWSKLNFELIRTYEL